MKKKMVIVIGMVHWNDNIMSKYVPNGFQSHKFHQSHLHHYLLLIWLFTSQMKQSKYQMKKKKLQQKTNQWFSLRYTFVNKMINCKVYNDLTLNGIFDGARVTLLGWKKHLTDATWCEKGNHENVNFLRKKAFCEFVFDGTRVALLGWKGPLIRLWIYLLLSHYYTELSHFTGWIVFILTSFSDFWIIFILFILFILDHLHRHQNNRHLYPLHLDGSKRLFLPLHLMTWTIVLLLFFWLTQHQS